MFRCRRRLALKEYVMASESTYLKYPLVLFAYALLGGMFTGTMAPSSA